MREGRDGWEASEHKHTQTYTCAYTGQKAQTFHVCTCTINSFRRDNTCHHIYSHHIWDEWHQPHICRHERCIQSDDTDKQLHHCRQFQAPPTWTYTYRYDYIYAHDASYIFINERTIAITSAQPVRATNDMCIVIYEAAKSHPCTCIFCGVQDSHSYTH